MKRMFLSGSDLRGVKLGEHVKQIDECNLRFEGDTTQGDFHASAKGRASLLDVNRGVWGFQTLWSELGRLSPHLALNEVSGYLRRLGKVKVVDTIPLFSLR